MRYIFIFISIVCCNCLFAGSVTKELATKVAYSHFINNVNTLSAMTIDPVNSVVDSTQAIEISVSGKAILYLVQMEDGWCLVSSERATKPILAYSSTGIFPTIEDMPSPMKWLLSYYEETIQFARDSFITNVVNTEWDKLLSIPYAGNVGVNYSKVLARMGLVHWNQNDNNDVFTLDCARTYNKFCPTWDNPQHWCGHTYVGCDAVALGQLLWFYQWPHSAVIPDSITEDGKTTKESHIVEYDWSLIPTDIYNSSPMQEVDAVAGLLRDCGYANKMRYGGSGSLSFLSDTKRSLENIFHYKNKIKHLYRSITPNWIEKLKTEIDEGRPIIYRGEGPDGGHAFVLYGYDVNDMFNINWGWGGGSENIATYSLDLLVPTNNNGSYNDKQAALFGVEPDYPTSAISSLEQSITYSDVSDLLFESYSGGSIIVNDAIINSNQNAIVYSGNSIYLRSPFQILRGATVHFAIKNMMPVASSVLLMEKRQNPSKIISQGSSKIDTIGVGRSNVFCEIFDKVLIVNSVDEMASITIYNAVGTLVLQTTQLTTNLSSFSKGVYIVCMMTIDNKIYQQKIIIT